MRAISFSYGIIPGLISAFLLWLGLPGGGEYWPVLLFALVPFLHLLNKEQGRSRFLLGVSAGFFHFLLQLYWIVIVLEKYGGLPWFLAVPALVLLSLYMAIYFGCFTLIGGFLSRKGSGTIVIWLLPALWVALDWLRSFLFSGFPWMDIGYGLWQMPQLIQSADVFGHYFITYLVVLVNCLIYFLLQKGKSVNGLMQLAAVSVVVAVVFVYGQYRIRQLEQQISGAEKVTIGIVQGNIDQSEKWSPQNQQRTIDVYVKSTVQLLDDRNPPRLVVWPETSLPFFPTRNLLMGEVQRLAQEKNVSLLTGSPWFEIRSNEEKQADFYNSAFVVNSDGGYGDKYFKTHLVPFGEYVPLQKFLFFLGPLVEAVGDFSVGKVGSPLEAGKIQAGALICFESIFPDITRKWVQSGANVLVNLTNDAWYGRSSAPSQSMAMTVFRAVESRRSLVRSANTGISGFIDPIGRVGHSSELFSVWAKSEKVVLLQGKTFVVLYGYFFGPFCFIVVLAMLLLRVRSRKVRG